MTGHWTICAWRSQRARWGVEIRRRPLIAHSQVRVHLGRRHWTLRKIWTGQA